MKLCSILIVLSFILVGCAVTPERLGISSIEWGKMTTVQKQNVLKESHQSIHPAKTIYLGPDVEVTLSKGTARMPPFVKTYPYKAVHFQMRPGECRSVRLISTEEVNHVFLKACYNGFTLSLDPSRYELNKRAGTMHINYHPLWKGGITYKHLSSSGYVRLRNVNVRIKNLTQIATVEDANPARD